MSISNKTLNYMGNKSDWRIHPLHIRFADYSVIVAKSMDQLLETLHDLNRASRRVGLDINSNKTKNSVKRNGYARPGSI